ncbi:MAG: DNA replication initiation control protein YabA [Streptococcaceae bacterium]|jgi:regulator of replication initiation timing|nr:DNA replication initiation control protein YabA [Streptococcaceae bacterium]
MANPKETLEELKALEAALADTYALTTAIKEALNDAITENTQLNLENEKLRARLADLDAMGATSHAGSDPTKMLKVYNDGFHVCHEFYGKKLEPDENCLLCQRVLYK